MVIIRVGGGYLTIDEFIDQHCNDVEDKKKLFGMVYNRDSINKDFKSYYYSQNHNRESKSAKRKSTNLDGEAVTDIENEFEEQLSEEEL